MKKKIIFAISIIFCALFCTSCSTDNLMPVEAEIPQNNFQISVDFPDCHGSTYNALPVNSQKGFTMYEGQGKAYIKVAEGVESFDLRFNNHPVDTSKCKGGKSYEINISSATCNDKNIVQVTNIKPPNIKNAVHVDVNYPVIQKGLISEADLDKSAVTAIEDIINADIENGFTSVQVAIIKNGMEFYTKSFGKVNSYNQDGTKKENSKDVTNDTMYDLASNTKMYATNFAIQYLVSKKTLDIDTKLVDIFGQEFANDIIDINYDGYANPGLDTRKKWKSELTVKDILHHEAGFPDDPQYFNDRFNQATSKPDPNVVNPLYCGANGDEATKLATLKGIFKTPPMYQPGTKNVYSDIDYMLLGFIVEKLTNKPLDQFVKETFYDPMGLTHVTFNPLQNGFSPDDCAATELNGNTRDGAVHFTNNRTNTLQGEVHDEKAYYSMGGVSGHAGLFANATDLAKLASVMLTGGYGDHKFFDLDTIDLFTSPADDDNMTFGLGWNRKADDKRVSTFGTLSDTFTIGHTGWTGTLTMIDKTTNTVFVILTNKINSPVTDKEHKPNMFNGNYFTSAAGAFIPSIISACTVNNEKGVKESLRNLMMDAVPESIRLAESYKISNMDANHPAIRNIYAKCEACIRFSDDTKDYCIGLLDQNRDKDEIEKLKKL